MTDLSSTPVHAPRSNKRRRVSLAVPDSEEEESDVRQRSTRRVSRRTQYLDEAQSETDSDDGHGDSEDDEDEHSMEDDDDEDGDDEVDRPSEPRRRRLPLTWQEKPAYQRTQRRGIYYRRGRRRSFNGNGRSEVAGDPSNGNSEDDSDGLPRKTWIKTRIHIPSDMKPDPKIVEYGSQKSPEQGSSPWRVRGPRWMLPRSMDPAAAAAPQFNATRSTPAIQEAPTQHLPAARDPPRIDPRIPTPSPPEESQLGEESVLGSRSTSQSRQQSQADIDRELAELPSDAFESSPGPESAAEDALPAPTNGTVSQRPHQRLVAPQSGLRQTTLFGGRVEGTESQSQANKVYNYRVDKPPEPPTHHELDNEALQTWVYPLNLGAIREYQYTIVKNGLFNNLLVALPTGLGKTFIAATVMLNFFRWTKSAQIVFVAPTKPLVAQQVNACFNLVGIPRSMTTLLTGEISPALRAEEWAQKRVFFMTPQTLDNDLRSGIADPKRIVLLVVDEAHRATGNYSYVKVVELLRRFNQSFRVLALTATPGSTIEAVQTVIDGLGISKVDIRTEDSIDIQPFVHQRQIDQVVLDPSDEMLRVQELFSKAVKPLMDQLCGQNAYYSRDPMSLTAFGVMKAQESWMKDAGRRANPALKGMMSNLFLTLTGIAHSVKLLNMHGMRPFYESIRDFRDEVEGKGSRGGKTKRRITEHADFKKMMETLQMWTSRDDFISHPKMTFLCDTVLNHFLDAGDGRAETQQSNTRIIVFSEYRSSAEEIVRVLNRHGPLVRASVFVGQAAAKGSEGMKQAKQQETISDFQKGKFNVLVATSIGEEGLDIGQVDLIVCYDSSASPIRMLQRMGRTGRKRSGKIVLLLMRKEEAAFEKAKHNYVAMQQLICSGDRFNFRHDLSRRIVPQEVKPDVDKRHIDIPLENTQNPELPEPKKRRGRAAKRPPKKFHMPDGVESGFTKASALTAAPRRPSPDRELLNLQDIPPLESVVLSEETARDLELRYLTVANDEEVEPPALDSQPESQRRLTSSQLVSHGQRSKLLVKTIAAILAVNDFTIHDFRSTFDRQTLFGDPEWLKLSYEQESEVTPASNKQPTRKVGTGQRGAGRGRRQAPTTPPSESDALSMDGLESDGDLSDFVVGDDEDLFDGVRSGATLSSSPPIQPAPKPYFDPTTFTVSQLTNDDDMPDITELVRAAPSSRAGREQLKEKASNKPQLQAGRARKRRIIQDGSDE